MVLRFRFSNFRSFRGEQDISLIASSLSDAPEATIEVPGSKERALRVCAIYGANASGKTTVLRALAFMYAAVRHSHRAWEPDGGVPLECFKDSESAGRPSDFVLDFELAGVRYQYGFRADRSRIVEEWLFTYPSGRKQVWFHRKPTGGIMFGRSLPGDNQTIASLMRPNSLFLSVAAQNNHEHLKPIYSWFNYSLASVFGSGRRITRTAHMCANDEDRRAVLKLLSVADLGIIDVRYELQQLDPAMQDKTKNIMEAMWKILDLNPAGVPGSAAPKASIKLLHQIGAEIVPFDLDEESDGTLAYVGLLGPIVSALKMGSMLLVDELDASLHPLLAMHVIKIFNDAATNPKSAQLIFNTHDTNLLSHGLLRRDQIWFTEKDGTGASHVYPLTDFKPRRDENLQGGYLQGRYGAIPFMNWEQSVPLEPNAQT